MGGPLRSYNDPRRKSMPISFPPTNSLATAATAAIMAAAEG